jgi:hypothetical protein
MAFKVLTEAEIDKATEYAERVGFKRNMCLRDEHNEIYHVEFSLFEQIGMEMASIDVHYEVANTRKRAFVNIYWGSASGNEECLNEFIHNLNCAKQLATQLSQEFDSDEFNEVMTIRYDHNGKVSELPVPTRLEGHVFEGYHFPNAKILTLSKECSNE